MASAKIVARLKNATPVSISNPTPYTVMNFFRECCRAVPYAIHTYELDEVITSSQLRRSIADKFRANAHVKDIRTVGHLLVKGHEELSLIMNSFKQRHHLMSEYVATRDSTRLIEKKSVDSPFLQQFYQSNYVQPRDLA